MARLALLWSRMRVGVITVLVVYVLVLVFAWIFPRRMIYFPDTDDVALPDGAAQQGLRDVTLRTEDGVTLKAWYWPGRRPGTVLMFHGDADRIAPIGHARRLYEKAREPKEWIEVKGAGHNDLLFVAGPRYWEGIRRFLDAHLAD